LIFRNTYFALIDSLKVLTSDMSANSAPSPRSCAERLALARLGRTQPWSI